ncbi:chalcone isomerase [Shewanella algae]|nr:chalcone isomerase [Shewanella algae]
MKKIILTALLLGLSLSATVDAREIASENIPDTLSIQAATPLKLNGAGVRSKFFMDLYIGSLYLPTKATTTAEVLTQPQAAVSLKIVSGLITADKMRSAITEGFDDATGGKTEAIQADIDRFMSLFQEEIKQGDSFLLYTSQENGVSAYKNGELQDTIAGENFRRALLNIWLGDKPAQSSLKKAMLAD